MNVARIAILGVAVAAGGLAALLAGGSDPQPTEAPAPPPVVQIQTTDVLVAKGDIGMGDKVSGETMEWQAWPTATAAGAFIRKPDRPDAIEKLSGSIARAPFSAGEPIRDNKLIASNGSGFMAAILPSGMRAISTQISPETGAGGFILPNDRVDVILTRREKDGHSSETILSNIRVLAIDQQVEDKDGKRVVVGRTATLELSPGQAETLALSQQLGSLSLALRSLVDSNKTKPDDDSGERRNTINMVRFGVGSAK